MYLCRMIKKEVTIPLMKVEDVSASNMRRENYALKRDQQNSEVNEAIAARLLRTAILKKCNKCGKSFTSHTTEDMLSCPECR